MSTSIPYNFIFNDVYSIEVYAIDNTSNQRLEISEDVHTNSTINITVSKPLDSSWMLNYGTLNTNNWIRKELFTLNPTLAISLHKQSLEHSTYITTALSSDVKNSTQLYCLHSVAVGNNIQIDLVDKQFINTNGLNKIVPFENNTTYAIAIDFDIVEGVASTGQNIFSFLFITADENIITINTTDNYSKYACNPLFKLKNIEHLTNIEAIILNESLLDYKFTPVKDVGNNTYIKELLPSGEDVVLKFDLSSQLEQTFVDQYLPDFSRYFDLINTEIAYRGMDITEFNNTKITFLKLAYLINSFVKGTFKGIEIVFKTFCNNFGEYNTFTLEKSPDHQNFVYRITTDLPKYYWDNVLKDIVHPIGWLCDYVEVDGSTGGGTGTGGAGGNGSNGNSNGAGTQVGYDSSITNTRPYMKNLSNKIISSQYASVPMISVDYDIPYSGYTHTYNLVAFSDIDKMIRFAVSPSIVQSEMTYENINTTEWQPYIDPSNIVPTIKWNGTVFKLMIEYATTGLATKYEFNVINLTATPNIVLNNDLYFPIFRAELPESWENNELYITVTILNDKMFKTTNGIVNVPNEPFVYTVTVPTNITVTKG